MLIFTLLSLLLPLHSNELKKLKEDLFWLNKVYGKEQYDIVLVGDSRTYKGISPEILEKYCKSYSVFNFGFSSGRINRQLLLEAYKKLKPNGARIFVFSCTPIDLINVKNDHWFDLYKELASLNKWPAQLYNLKLKLVPWQERKKLIKAKYNFSNYWEMYHKKSGWCACWQKDIFYESTFKSYKEQFAKRSFRKTDLHDFLGNLKWCKENNINVIAFRMISCPEMDILEDRLSGCNFVDVKNAVLQQGGIWLERPNHLQFRSYDASHLDYQSAEKFSNWLGKKLKKILFKIEK
ncbi:MAG: hypothetical protein ACLRFH_01645 [Opitutales bacterium]